MVVEHRRRDDVEADHDGTGGTSIYVPPQRDQEHPVSRFELKNIHREI